MIDLPRTPVRFAAAIMVWLATSAAPAFAAVPADIQIRLEDIAQSWRTAETQQQRMAQLSGDRHMGAFASAMNRRVSASRLSEAIMEAMARNPADARDTLEASLRAAPELRDDIKSSLSMALPALADMIEAAGRPPPAPLPAVSVARPAAAAAARPVRARDPRDPYETVNRVVFGANSMFDIVIVEPIARLYRFIMPETLRAMSRNFFENFNEPVVAVNDLLQGDFENAATSVGRFAVNSTIGILGFFEVAERIDLEQHPADFGQTLHRYGMGDGGYVVLPLLGPTTLRDAFGQGVDMFLNPIAYLLDLETRLYLKATEIVVQREAAIETVNMLRDAAPDYYSAARAAWFAKRERELRKEPPPVVRDTMQSVDRK